MAWRPSLGLRNALLDTDSLKDILANGIIRIYSGGQPADAEAAETGTLLCVITVDGEAVASGTPANGLNLGDAAEGKIQKAAAETWEGENLDDGYAGWFRWYPNDYDNHEGLCEDESMIRIDGRCGTSTGELRMSSTNLAVGVDTVINNVELELP